MYEEIADLALDYLKKKGVQYGEARLEEHHVNSFMTKNGILEHGGFETSRGLGIRFLLKNSLGFVSINEFDKNKIKNNINKALRNVNKGSNLSQNVKLSEEKSFNKKYKVLQKVKIEDVDTKEKLKLLFDSDNATKEALGRQFIYHDDITRKYFVNTDGTKIESEIPRVNFMYFITVKSGSRSGQKYWQFCNSGGYERIRKKNIPELMRNEYNAIKKNLKEAIKPPTERLDLVVGPEVTGIMVHESVGHPFEADRIFGREAAQAGESFVHKGMIDTKIGNDVVTVVDDPLVENSAGFYEYDDEGVKARRRFLIKDGMIKEFLHNRETAVEMNLKSNGSARAEDFDKEAIVRMANTFLLPGDFKEEELFEGVKKGVYMKDFTEWNIDDRRFQMKFVGSNAFLIENGKITKPVYRPVIEITTPSLWSSVDAVGKNLEYHTGTCGKGEPQQGVPAYLGGPSFRIREIRLG